MPTLTSGLNSIKLQTIVDYARTYPELVPILGTAGFTMEPSKTLANDVAQRIFAEGMNWKWNRVNVPPFLTSALQQDYLTQVTDMGWLEKCTCVDINNNTNDANRALKPVFTMETVRDIMPTSSQGRPFQIAWIPNKLATLGLWQPNTLYASGYGVAEIPNSPIQSFMDANGNLLYIDSTVLGINPSSPGFNGTPITLPVSSPYGTSGSVQPVLPTLTPAGTTVQDGSVIWTVANPDGVAMRVSPASPLSGLCYLVQPVYQRQAPTFDTLQDVIFPIPNDQAYLFRQGLIAMLYDHAGSPKAMTSYAKWEETLRMALTAADREQEDSVMYPSSGLMSGNYGGGNIGPANPYLGCW